MQGFIHTINRLPPAPTHGGMIIDDMRSQGHVAYEINHILVGSKTGPYSDKDAMVIYDGENPHITTWLQLPVSVQREMLSTAFRVGEVLWHQNKQNIVSGREFFLVGTNMGVKPAPRMIQTMANPHFHTTLFPQYPHGEITDRSLLQMDSLGDYLDDGRGGKFSTEVVNINPESEEHQRIFCIRPNNFVFRGEFMDDNPGWEHSNIYTLDTPLRDQQQVFTSEDNMKQFHEAYTRANQYIRSMTIGGIPDNRGFGISIIYDAVDRTWKIRLALMEKKDSQDNGSICESSGHSIIRKVVDNPSRIIDNRGFVNGIGAILTQLK